MALPLRPTIMKFCQTCFYCVTVLCVCNARVHEVFLSEETYSLLDTFHAVAVARRPPQGNTAIITITNRPINRLLCVTGLASDPWRPQPVSVPASQHSLLSRRVYFGEVCVLRQWKVRTVTSARMCAIKSPHSAAKRRVWTVKCEVWSVNLKSERRRWEF